MACGINTLSGALYNLSLCSCGQVLRSWTTFRHRCQARAQRMADGYEVPYCASPSTNILASSIYCTISAAITSMIFVHFSWPKGSRIRSDSESESAEISHLHVLF
jgi:hypothetical protein